MTSPRLSLLMVDDDEAFRERASRALESRGWDVRTAATVEEGLAVATEDPPEFAVVETRDQLTGSDWVALIDEDFGEAFLDPGAEGGLDAGFEGAGARDLLREGARRHRLGLGRNGRPAEAVQPTARSEHQHEQPWPPTPESACKPC